MSDFALAVASVTFNFFRVLFPYVRQVLGFLRRKMSGRNNLLTQKGDTTVDIPNFQLVEDI
ncbi:MAG: hypothetical protein KME25_31020 [Symplocastrum torsivum CPER-KK1]|uniref:Uncharacterized protein n=1 Tax=Symplocastrum torsivum CPER-KK1 TaxID=450513 RepID=A0A951UCT9_9CYAN|nr:hypothetical protein [Symplocastrum torsivum CPER-KK1]